MMHAMIRTDVTFPSDDDQCAAWLYIPALPATHGEEAGSNTTATTEPKRPVIVLAHGLGGVKEERLDAFAERFTAAGYVCLVFDYRHFGASEGEPRQLLDIGLQREDWRSAVAFARTLDGVDPDRVVVWGTSFGGGHVIVTAAEDPRIAAAISQCPFTNGLASSRTMPPLTSLKLTGRAIADFVGARLGRLPVMVPTYGPPGATAMMTAPDVVCGIEKLMPAGAEPSKNVAARFALHIVRDFPGRQAKNVACPVFFAICERDSVAPHKPSQRYAAQAPRGEVKLYDAGHFDIYVGDAFERNIADQLDFLARHVPTT
jgi:pimeloyl-ACP methyl ester carboxylesterase